MITTATPPISGDRGAAPIEAEEPGTGSVVDIPPDRTLVPGPVPHPPDRLDPGDRRDHGRRMTGEVLRYAAFTDGGSGGDPAGVVLDAGSLNDSEMLAIARDVGYSETAFVLPIDSTAAIRVRYFSPLAEVAFCGHATVATAVALDDRDGPGGLDLITLAGPVGVTTTATDEGMVATLTSPAAHSSPVTAPVLRATPWRRSGGSELTWTRQTPRTSPSRGTTTWCSA